MVCEKCGEEMKYRDKVKRWVRTGDDGRYQIDISRYRCAKCGAIRRELPEGLLRFKQYEAEVIFGVVDGAITVFTEGFEDYPSEMTMKRWKDIFGKK